ncbi:P-loop NTPase family protein [Siccirubricoccus phaeus]|uniref:chromosomal replication initiator DnaA n=1 Tax=Siccirubricoccus phaeus TaxID=2595053 RepID=UPI0011F3902A|nr:chromosomal replication initiator DnaA [Siccirubricoccus phaeus]
MRQLALPLRLPPPAPGALLEDASNAEALAWLARPEAWPQHRLALYGPAATGKSHMLAEFAARHAWPSLPGPAIRGLPDIPAAPGLTLDDADCALDEAALFHLLNICAERRQAVLLAGRAPPARWPVKLPDLASRLRAITAVGVQPPTDTLLAALLRKHFAALQLRVDPAVQGWLLLRLPREAAAMAAAARTLNEAALAAGGAVTRTLARTALRDWPGFDPAPLDDVSMAGEAAPSPSAPCLL